MPGTGKDAAFIWLFLDRMWITVVILAESKSVAASSLVAARCPVVAVCVLCVRLPLPCRRSLLASPVVTASANSWCVCPNCQPLLFCIYLFSVCVTTCLRVVFVVNVYYHVASVQYIYIHMYNISLFLFHRTFFCSGRSTLSGALPWPNAGHACF